MMNVVNLYVFFILSMMNVVYLYVSICFFSKKINLKFYMLKH